MLLPALSHISTAQNLKNSATRIGSIHQERRQRAEQRRRDISTEQPPAPPETKEASGEAKQPEETPTVEIPTDKQQLIGVRTVKAAIQPLHRVIRTVGRIEFDEKKLATANTKIEGWIEKLHVDYVGRYVQKGEPLAEIFSPELVATQQEFLNILRWANQGKGREG